MRPGFFFFLPSPKLLCPEVLAVAMPMLLLAELGCGPPLCLRPPGLWLCCSLALLSLRLRGRCPLDPRASCDLRRVRLRGGAGVLVLAPVQALCQSPPPSPLFRPSAAGMRRVSTVRPLFQQARSAQVLISRTTACTLVSPPPATQEQTRLASLARRQNQWASCPSKPHVHPVRAEDTAAPSDMAAGPLKISAVEQG